MLLVLSDEHKEHLSFLTKVDSEGKFASVQNSLSIRITMPLPLSLSVLVVKEFCKISLEFIKKGVNPRVYQSAARE